MYQLGFKKNSPVLILFFSALIIVLLYFVSRISIVNHLLGRIVTPWQAGWQTAAGNVNEMKSKAELIALNEALEKQVTESIVDSARLRMLEVENQTLRQQLDFLEESSYQFIIARIVSSTSDFNFSGFVINRGAADGLSVGLPVIVGDGILIGQIVEVHQSSAIVMLVTDNQSKIAATVQNNDLTIGLVQGGHGLTVNMNMIPHAEDIQPGDIVISSGLQDKIPAGLVIGTVESIDRVSSQLFASALIKPLADYHKLNLVTVLLP